MKKLKDITAFWKDNPIPTVFKGDGFYKPYSEITPEKERARFIRSLKRRGWRITKQ